MLKKIILIAIIGAQSIFSGIAIAGTKGTDQSVGYNWDKVYIHNLTNNDLAYEIHGSSIFNGIYGIQKQGTDVYHAGSGDDFAYIRVGICSNYQFPDHCEEFQNLNSCVTSHYDINQVSDITINPDMHCDVKCRDGSSTSCKR